MLRALVPFRVLVRQPLTLTISLLGSGLSFTLTLRFCQHHWPDDLVLLLALGLLWELGKLHLASRGLRDVHRGRGVVQRLGGASLVLLAALLAAGSVAASIGCLSQADARDRHRALASSRAYNSALVELQSLDEQIELLSASAAHDLAGGYRKRSLDTSSSIVGLRARRGEAAAAVQVLERGGTGVSEASTAEPNTARIRLLIHTAIAVILELVGVAAMVMLERGCSIGTSPPLSKGRRRAKTVVAPEISPSPLPGEPLPHTRRLQFRIGSRLQARLDQLHPSRRRGACQDLVRAIGEYALKFAGTDGAVTEAQMRALSAGRTWRVTQGYLDLLLGVGALRHDSQGTYTLLYFLDENPSVAARAAFARRQREQATPRKQRERSRTKVESTSNQQISDTKNNVLSTTCIERHAESTNHQEGAKAATHLPTPRRPGVIPPPELEAICDALANPWDKYLQAGQGTDQGVAAMDVTPAKVALPTKRGPRKKAHRCIPARISDDPAPVNEHSVVTVFRELGLTVDTVRVRDTLLKLRARGAREATVRYALHCVKARRGKVRIDNPISYLMSIVENQQTATLASVAG